MSEIKIPQNKIDQLLAICDEHGNRPGELINILHKAQHLFGYLPPEVQRIVAGRLGIPVSKVYGVVTFYSFFTMTPKGEHPISVCMGTASLRCVGACGLAPVVLIGEKVFGRVVPGDVERILKELE